MFIQKLCPSAMNMVNIQIVGIARKPETKKKMVYCVYICSKIAQGVVGMGVVFITVVAKSQLPSEK